MEWFLSGVNTYVSFHIPFRVEPLVADLADERFKLSVHHPEVFGEAKTINKALAALLTDMDPTIAMHPAMSFKTFCVCEAFPTERTREGSAT